MNDQMRPETYPAAINVDDATARQLHGTSAMMQLLLAFGILMMLSSLSGPSMIWTGYVLLTGWLGIVTLVPRMRSTAIFHFSGIRSMKDCRTT